MMVKDHSAANDKLSALAGGKNITLLDERQRDPDGDARRS